MKKSQILAALALAFALGVVAPVVTVNDTYAFTVPNSETHTEGKATKKDVETVVAAIKAEYPLAERMHNLNALITGSDAIKAADDLATAGHRDEASDPIVTVAKAANDVYNNLGTGFPTYKDSAVIFASENYVDQINAAINAAVSVPDYTVVANFVAANTDAELQSAIAAFNGVFGTNINSDTSVKMAQKSTIASQIEAAVNTTHTNGAHEGHPASANYSAYVNLYNAVVAATKARDTYTANYNALHNALTAGGVLNEAGMVALGNNDRATNPTIAALLAIANDTYTNNLSGWNTFYNTLANAYAIDADSNTNYNIILGLTGSLKTLANLTTETPVEIAQDLLKYEGPVADLPTQNPADNNNGQGSNLPGAGNTGTVAGADATAKATVSIMAAIASVATAAFVAIRKIAAGKKA